MADLMCVLLTINCVISYVIFRQERFTISASISYLLRSYTETVQCCNIVVAKHPSEFLRPVYTERKATSLLGVFNLLFTWSSDKDHRTNSLPLMV